MVEGPMLGDPAARFHAPLNRRLALAILAAAANRPRLAASYVAVVGEPPQRAAVVAGVVVAEAVEPVGTTPAR